MKHEGLVGEVVAIGEVTSPYGSGVDMGKFEIYLRESERFGEGFFEV